MLNDVAMFNVYGWRKNAISGDVRASFFEDSSIREYKSVDTWNVLGTWRWNHADSALEVFIPGDTVTLNLDSAVTSYLTWLAKQVVN